MSGSPQINNSLIIKVKWIHSLTLRFIIIFNQLHIVTPVPMLFIGFEQAAYTFSESQATTPQLCVTISGASDGVRAVVQITTSPETAQGSYTLCFLTGHT